MNSILWIPNYGIGLLRYDESQRLSGENMKIKKFVFNKDKVQIKI